MTKTIRLALVLTAPLLLNACASVDPWVKPYQRQHLADIIMAGDRNPISSSYLHHVFEAREGARGARGRAGSGCGCN